MYIVKKMVEFLLKKLNLRSRPNLMFFFLISILYCLVLHQYNDKQLPLLHQHVIAKHEGTDPVACFSQLAGYDPNDPKGEKAAAANTAKKAATAKKKKSTGLDLDDLLNAGLKKK